MPTGLCWVSELTAVVFWALTGETPVEEQATGDLRVILRANGWGPDRLARLKHDRQRSGLAWPLPMTSLPPGIGAAQALAAVKRAVAELGLDEDRRVRRPAVSDADTRRLLDEVPPHHGSVG